MEVLLLLEMEEEMKERMMVEFVVEMKEKWWRSGWPKEGEGGSLLLPLFSVNQKEDERKRMKGRERRSGVFIKVRRCI